MTDKVRVRCSILAVAKVNIFVMETPSGTMYFLFLVGCDDESKNMFTLVYFDFLSDQF